MSENKKVSMHIESISEEQQIIQNVIAEYFYKGDAVYYRYEEPDHNMGRITTTLKIKGNEIKVVRHGDIQSEQLFQLDSLQPGYYHTASGKMNISNKAKEIKIDLDPQGYGQISWSYELFLNDEHSGDFALKIQIQEDNEA
ncbi:DUF1934 domain-containing protein [Chengkuizengella axinellae]|uniref:DUF1934 domain-containing protein n=1 Tax=Chengkuizengella axinellae TaxID=3064388 RepID=A0ABT9IZC7_9BACL|nr:DUF1934 domain-containing protein [Chengkuizengella sp. 2205SS18-9]MDP5274668.1 DUF1934 domain-containing protein [Chengkuizengella sp. 2205SS18-9]